MNLPPHTELSVEVLHVLAERYGLEASPITRLPETGIFNAVYLLGEELVLRVPRQHPAHIAALYNEAAVVPAARAAGVSTPALIAFDDSQVLLPVPYTVYERIHGDTLGLLELEPANVADAWRKVGEDLARLHTCVGVEDLDGDLPWDEPLSDPRALVEERGSQGYFTGSEARWLLRWLEQLAPKALVTVPPRVVHGDVQGTNVIVGRALLDYRAIIDWGSARWADVAHDFAAVPLRAVPYLLSGYRAIAPLDSDETAEVRILWRYLQLALYIVPRQPDPLRAWAERPWSLWLELMRFFAGTPARGWVELAPPSR